MLANHRNSGLFVKELRVRLPGAALFSLGGGLIAAVVLDNWEWRSSGIDWVCVLIALAAPWIRLYDGDEWMAGRGALQGLPLSRRRILWTKLGSMFVIWLALLGGAGLVSGATGRIPWQGFTSPSEILPGMQNYFLFFSWTSFALASLCIGLLFAIMSLHFSSSIVAGATSLLAAIPTSFFMSINCLAMPGTNDPLDGVIKLALRSLVLAILMSGWLHWLGTRSRLMELSARARMFLAPVFVLSLMELIVLLFFTDLHEIYYLIFGF